MIIFNSYVCLPEGKTINQKRIIGYHWHIMSQAIRNWGLYIRFFQ